MNVVIIQARMGSSRLPGKVLLDLQGVPVIAHVLARAEAIPGIDRVCCAVPEGSANDLLVYEVMKRGFVISRGPEADVLTRYLIAARATQADVIIRVTSDCPLLDPQVSGRVLNEFLAGGADYVSNVDPRTWPRGLDTEIFSRAGLELAAERASAAYEREHVTPWLRNSGGISRRNVSLATGRFADWRWTLDYEQDLAFMRVVLAHLPPFPYLAGFEDIRALVETRPDIAAINTGIA